MFERDEGKDSDTDREQKGILDWDRNPGRTNVNFVVPAPVQEESAIAEGATNTGTLNHHIPLSGGSDYLAVATREQIPQLPPTSTSTHPPNFHPGRVASKQPDPLMTYRTHSTLPQVPIPGSRSPPMLGDVLLVSLHQKSCKGPILRRLISRYPKLLISRCHGRVGGANPLVRISPESRTQFTADGDPWQVLRIWGIVRVL